MANQEENMPSTHRTYTFDRVVRLLIGLVITVAAIWMIHKLSSVLIPFFGAWLLAFILEPIVQLNKKALHVRRRFFPVVITLLEVIVVIVGLILLFAPSILNEINEIDRLAHVYLSNPENTIIPDSVKQFISDHVDIQGLLKQMSGEDWKSLVETFLSFLSSGVSIIISFVGWFVLFIYLFFIMLDYDNLAANFEKIVPKKYQHTTNSIMDYVKNSIGHYFRGQTLIAFIVGILFSIGFLIIDMPLAIALGLFIGMLNMVPYLQLISIPVATLLCLMSTLESGAPFWPFWWECMLVYVVVQLLQDLVITPRIMGKAMNLNPAIIFLSLSVWGSLLGFVGLIIALPLTALLIAMYKEYVLKYYNSDTKPERVEAAQAIGDIMKVDD